MGRNLITGGFGLLGRHLARHLLKDGEEVVLFDNVINIKLIEDIKDRIKIVLGDLSNYLQILDAVNDNEIDCIYHVGAMLFANAEANPKGAYAVNIQGTFSVLEATRLLEVDSLIFASSQSVYGRSAPPATNDDVITVPDNMYGLSKFIGEQLGAYYHRVYGLNFRGVRFPLLVGPGGSATGITRYASLIVQEPSLGRPYRPYVDQSIQLPFLYVKDAARGLITLKKADESCLKRRVYNLEGVPLIAGEEADIVRKYLPQAEIEFVPDESMMQLFKTIRINVDGSRAREEWGFNTLYNPDEAIKDFINEIQNNRSLYG